MDVELLDGRRGDGILLPRPVQGRPEECDVELRIVEGGSSSLRIVGDPLGDLGKEKLDRGLCAARGVRDLGTGLARGLGFGIGFPFRHSKISGGKRKRGEGLLHALAAKIQSYAIGR